MNDKGFFGKAYDFDRDGKLNSWERAADTIAFQKMCEELDKPVEQPYVPQKKENQPLSKDAKHGCLAVVAIFMIIVLIATVCVISNRCEKPGCTSQKRAGSSYCGLHR